MRDTVTVLLGRLVRAIARLRGGGSALPGLVVEKIDPKFLARTLQRLPEGVVVISGTNGKTTTTKIVVELLQKSGLRVFTNSTGSNFSRGVIAAILQQANLRGEIPADIAVLELDEAHAIHFIAQVKPRFTLLLNVLRDQLDRFGEIDTTARLLEQIAEATKDGLVVNREDVLVRAIGVELAARRPEMDVRQFGLAPALRTLFPSDAELHGGGQSQPVENSRADVTLVSLGDHEATFEMDAKLFVTGLKLEGVYNTLNAAAALTLVRLILAHLQTSSAQSSSSAALLDALSVVRPAFGRGEQLVLDGHPLDLILVKNPAGFRLALTSFNPDDVACMIAINDNDADGRDMSWLWDVSFQSLRSSGVDTVAGSRAWDMALRLQHDSVSFREVHESLDDALSDFREHTRGRARRIYCTYTAMLELRKALAKLTEVENVW